MAQYYEGYRYEITSLGTYSGADARLVAKAGSLRLYRKGATITTGFTSAPGGGLVTCAISDPGTIVPGDTVVVGTGAVQGTVEATNYGPGTLDITWNPGGFTATAGQRIIVVSPSSTPTAYADPYLVNSIAQPITFGATDGYTAFYCREPEVDIIRTVNALTDVLPDVAGTARPETLSPLVAGMRADGTTQDAPALNNRITYAKAKGKAVIELPPGDIMLRSTAAYDGFNTACNIDGISGLTFKGAGVGVTRFICDEGSTQLFYLGRATATTNVTFENLSFVRTVAGSNTLVRVEAAAIGTRFRNVEFIGGQSAIIDKGTETEIDAKCSGTGWTRAFYFFGAKRPKAKIYARYGNSLGAGVGFIEVEDACENVDLNVDVTPTDIGLYRGTGLIVRAGASIPSGVRVVGNIVAGTASGGYPAVVLSSGRGISCDLTVMDSQIGYSIGHATNAEVEAEISGTVVGMEQHGVQLAACVDLVRFTNMISSNVSNAAANNYHHFDCAATTTATHGVSFNNVFVGNVVRPGGIASGYGLNGASVVQLGTSGEIVDFRSDASMIQTFNPDEPYIASIAMAGPNNDAKWYGLERLTSETQTTLDATLTCGRPLVYLNPGGNRTITAIAGRANQLVRVINIHGTNTVQFTNGASLKTKSGANVTLNQYQGITFIIRATGATEV